MNPQSGAAISAHVENSSAETSAEAGTVDPMKQFIWENAPTLAETTATERNALDDREVTSKTPDENDETLTRIVVLSEDEEETSDSWRRQLISALRDADRDTSHAKSLPTEPPPIPPAEIPRRPPIALVASHARTTAAQPVERRPRHRMTPVLLGISAAAGLLTIAVPRAANVPDTGTAATASEAVITGSFIPAAGDDASKPNMLNSPVLVREGMSRGQQTALPVGPVIETVRTVPVQIGASPLAGAQMSNTAPPAIEQPTTPRASPQTSPTTVPPLDRGRLAALIYDEPAAPPKPSAIAAPPPAPAPAEPAEKAASAPAEAAKPAKARNPQVSTAYQRSLREKPRAKKRTSKKRTQTKTATRSSDKAKWDTRRQGLRTSAPTTEVKEVEPSTMVKLLKSLNPFASKEESQTRPKKNIFE